MFTLAAVHSEIHSNIVTIGYGVGIVLFVAVAAGVIAALRAIRRRNRVRGAKFLD